MLEPGYNFMVEHYFDALIETNKAWAVMLVEAGIVERSTGAGLMKAILELEREGRAGMGSFDPRYEYFYSHMERYLIEHAGEEVAGEINIGRTRPEPLARMATRSRLLQVLEGSARLRARLLQLADGEIETVMPQWTHCQPAQPSTLGHYLVAIHDALERDFRRLSSAYQTTNQCTLGCGALAGTSYDIDRARVAELLGFDGFVENTIDCVSGADWAIEVSNAVATMMVTISRFCEDLYFWQTWEFGFVEIGDEYAGSSSMMPQKKNAYPFEYVRARGGRAIGEATAALATLHNTNYQDIKDVEEEVVIPVLRVLDEVIEALRLLEGALASLSFKRDRMLDKAADGFSTASELAAQIHRRNPSLSYRSAHRVVGGVVRRAVETGVEPLEVKAELVQEAAAETLGFRLEDLDDGTVRRALDPRAFVDAHDVPGGPAPVVVQKAIESAHTRLQRDTAATERAQAQLHAAEKMLATEVRSVATAPAPARRMSRPPVNLGDNSTI